MTGFASGHVEDDFSSKRAGLPEQRLTFIDPLKSTEWDSLVAAYPNSSFFHSRDWARVLAETYGHSPAYCCGSSASGRVTGILPVMEVSSRWVGRRGVSLPFTDFCTPLVSDGSDGANLYGAAIEYGRQRGWRTFESRNSGRGRPKAARSVAYWSHTLDLGVGAKMLFAGLKASVRRGVRKAERAGLRVEFSDSMESTRIFYRLHCVTRRRHGMPCQPVRFFDNIARFMLAKGHGFVATAFYGQRAIAAAIFLHQAQEVFYKFGASDYQYQELRPNNLVMWEAIKKCCGDGFARLQLGRTSLHQEGLRRFKLGFGACESPLEYFKYDYRKEAFVAGVDHADSPLKHVFRILPLPLLRWAGGLVYPEFA